MPLYTGDYRKKTAHLGPLKHGIYLLLLMYSWDTKGPVPLDEQECAGICNCRSADEIDSLRYVLARYWVQMEDGWYQERMQQEIERAECISSKLSEAGRRGYEARAKTLTNRKNLARFKPGSSQADARASTLTLTLTPTITTTETTKDRDGFEVPNWIPIEPWNGWLEARAKKPPTARARRLAVTALARFKGSGMDPAKVLDQSTMNSWAGVFALRRDARGGAVVTEDLIESIANDPRCK